MEQILGQERALEVLQAGFASGRLHHAYIFHGPAGIGKFTTALAFSRLLLCHQVQTDLRGRASACGHCESCRMLGTTVNKGEAETDLPTGLSTGHPDLHVITKELARYSDNPLIRERKLLTIPFEVLRDDLIAAVYLQAQLRHNKVFIVDEAELIDTRGQNILLKTLEEPPAGTFLILITANEDRLLPTIRSRCQRVAFVPLGEAVLTAWLKARKAELSAVERTWLLSFAGGSLGRVELALDYGLLAWGRTVPAALDEMASGRFVSGLGKDMAAMIENFAEAWVKRHKNGSKEAANKRAAGLMWAVITQHVRQRLAESAKKMTGLGTAEAEQRLNPWLNALATVEDTERDVAANVNMNLACDHLAVGLYRALSGGAAGQSARRAG